MLLQGIYDFPPVLLVEMFPHSASVTGRPWSPWEGALALFSGLGESELIYLGGGGVLVFSLRDIFPVGLRLCWV